MISQAAFTLDKKTFDRYAGLSLPRHVSYPMPTGWQDADDDDGPRMRAALDERADDLDLSLYVHIPFCEGLCKFCACCRIVQRKTAPRAEEKTASYVDALISEIQELGEQYGTNRKMRQVHWGGGTPTYLSHEDMQRIHQATVAAFSLADDAEVSIEVDPRVAGPDTLRFLRELGFNRISLGVQDFDAQVQEHVMRVQPFEMVKSTADTCRELGFHSINFDLIYGLPYQTMESVRDTLEKVIELSPDRIAYYHYAQVPEKIATQRVLHHDKMPDSETKLAMFLMGARMFQDADYDFIGLDHFAKKDEMLAQAAREGSLQRNFQGMTTGAGLHLLGAGTSSISHLNQVGFLQNERLPDDYVAAIAGGESIIRRSKQFSQDDCIRQAVIAQIYCGARIVPAVIEDQFGISFAEYFAREMQIMRELEEDGLVEVDEKNNVDLTFPLGRVLMRNVAAVFDAYLEPDAYRVGARHCYSTNA